MTLALLHKYKSQIISIAATIGGLFAVLVITATTLPAQGSLYSVASPVNGQTFHSGDIIPIVVSEKGSYHLTYLAVVSGAGSDSHNGLAPLSIPIPTGFVGPLALMIDGEVGSNKQFTQVNVTVTPGVSLSSITAYPHVIQIVAPNTSDDFPTFNSLTVTGHFADGVNRDITNQSDTSFASDNPRVASISAGGVVNGVAPGIAHLYVTNGGYKDVAKVEVNIFPTRGDLNGDYGVDKNDIAILTKALNAPATGPDDPRDLNHDGRIDALDARIMTTLCSRPGCATQ